MFSTKPEQIGRSSALLESASSSSEDEPLEKVLKNIGSSQQKLQKESKKPSLSFEQDKAPPVIAKVCQKLSMYERSMTNTGTLDKGF